ncbi:MAG: Rpn family recombination-promoting nuclease/putative transposase [Phormidium tanganyikae FI6-MK23]|nr:Rpn family recombination-promoting nuclease/putative transposase [Phormidium tanganyikae FI6-MK23]
MTTAPSANYDAPWKEALERYFEPFLAFFFPQIHAEIDWQLSYESLDSEFQQVVRDAEIGKRFVDKLVKVWRRDGQETWVLIHVEIQSQYDSDFAKRMYTYSYRIFDRYNRNVVSLAILGDDQLNWRPQAYHYTLWGCRVGIEFPIVKLLDYESQWDFLEQSLNPYAMLVRAHLLTQKTSGDSEDRLTWKLRLVQGMQALGYSEDTILELFRLVDLMMTLPPELDQIFDTEVRRFGAENAMPYLTTIERFAIERGKLQNARVSVMEVLDVRFGAVPPELIDQINQMEDLDRLKQLLRQATVLASIADFQVLLLNE